MRLSTWAFALAVFACVPLIGASSSAAKVVKKHHRAIKNEFIVTLRPELSESDAQQVIAEIEKAYGVEAEIFWPLLPGFFVRTHESTVAELLSSPDVTDIEPNIWSEFGWSSTESTWSFGDYLWYMDRLDDVTYNPDDKQYDMCSTASDVYAYVIDRGVWNGHQELIGRVARQLDFTTDSIIYRPPGKMWAYDQTGGCGGYAAAWHGTAVGSLISGSTLGTSEAKIVSLKITPCGDSAGKFTTADLINAMQWISSTDNPWRSNPGIINMSGFVGEWNTDSNSVTTAANNLVISTGLPFFKSADNWSVDACRFAPNSLAYTNIAQSGKKVFVVGASSVSADPVDRTDYRYQEWSGSTPLIGQNSGSNSGACISAWAPGVAIKVAQTSTSASYSTRNGTSFSAPIAAGVGARYVSKYFRENGVRPSYSQVYSFLLTQAVTTPVVTNTPHYWVCINSDGFYNGYRYDPGTCPPGYPTKLEYPSVSNAAGAKMLYWDEAPNGHCP
jgi:hypothetical protein